MKKVVKEYMAFTPHGCKILQLIVLPILTILAIVENYHLWSFNGYDWYLKEVAWGIPMVEIICDYWRFGGFCNKYTNYTEYFIFAGKGKKSIRRILVIDILRKIITVAGAFLMGYMFLLFESVIIWDVEPLSWLYEIILATYGFTIIGSIIVRYTTRTAVALSIAISCSYGALMSTIYLQKFYDVWLLRCSRLIFITGSVVCVWLCMRKVETSFYDKED